MTESRIPPPPRSPGQGCPVATLRRDAQVAELQTSSAATRATTARRSSRPPAPSSPTPPTWRCARWRRRAGVGQATLYRNFPSRGALAAEILDEHVERIAALAAEHAGEPDAFFVLLRGLVDGMVDLYGVAVLARRDADTDSQLEGARRRIAELLKEPLRDAKAAGTLRRDFSADGPLPGARRWRAGRWRAWPTPPPAPPSPTGCWR